jgi:hypothetical protein
VPDLRDAINVIRDRTDAPDDDAPDAAIWEVIMLLSDAIDRSEEVLLAAQD